MPEDAQDERCPKATDGIHCRCWWDGEACCTCKAPAMTEAQKREQGMIDPVPPR